jgi:hypothetical protein
MKAHPVLRGNVVAKPFRGPVGEKVDVVVQGVEKRDVAHLVFVVRAFHDPRENLFNVIAFNGMSVPYMVYFRMNGGQW